ncbi:hypothetical protein [Leptolyngbya iicbica]|nr:hypothetical protein [Leptolyngbya sp. LK]
MLSPSAQTPSKAQSPSGANGFCYYVRASTNLYTTPSFAAEAGARFAAGDRAYATTIPPTFAWNNSVGTNFVAVAIYDGNTAWVPLYNPDGTQVLEEYPPEDCPNPGLNAATFPITGDPQQIACFGVKVPTNVYSEPSFNSAVRGRYGVGDTAYRSSDFTPDVPLSDGTWDGNTFIAVSIYDGSKAWVPRQRPNNTVILEDLAECP